MTKINIFKNDKELTYTAKDHAENPVVCAAISAISYALAGTIDNHYFIEIKEKKLEDGDVSIKVVSDSPLVVEDFRLCAIGLKQLEILHGQWITVETNLI